MVDNTTLDAGSGGDVIATDDIGGVKYQINKIAYGALDSATLVTTSAPLPVDIRAENASVTVDNGGTFAVQVDGDALTALQLIDDVIVADDAAFTPATTKVAMAGFEFDDTTPDSVDEGDAGAARMSANRNIYTQIRDAAGNERGANVDANNALLIQEATALDVSGATVTVAGTGTFATQVDGDALTALQLIDNIVLAEDAVHGSGDPGVMSLAVRNDTLAALAGADGDYAPFQVNASGALFVQEGAAMDVSAATVTVDNGGTFAVQVDGSALTALQLIDDAIYVDDADWTDSTSKHMLVGGLYQSSPQSITDGDVGPLSLTSDGALRVSGSSGVTEYNEDDASPATIVGNAGLMERDDALSALTPIEGDWVGMRASAEGALWVQDFNSDAILADTANMDTNLGTVAGAVSGSEMQVDVVAALPAGTNAIGKLAANSGVDIGDVDVLSIAAGTNQLGSVFVDASASSDGTSTYYDNDLDETKAEVTDNPTVRIYSIHAMNTTAAPLYLQMFDLDADNVTVGTTTPTNQYIVPGNADSDGAGFVAHFNPPKAYSTGFTVACTTDSEGSSAPGANACHVNIEYVSSA